MDEQHTQDVEVVELIGEDGVHVLFEHLMTIEHKNESYLMLTPLEPENEHEEGMVYILRIDKDDKGIDCYVAVEDEDLQNEVYERFLALMAEMEEDEDDEEGEDTLH